MIAVCLLTADRLAYTRTTLATFAAQHPTHRFGALLHADDASTDPIVPALPTAYGFETVAASTKRQGWMPMRLALFAAAARRGASWVLWLENDIEWARPFPWALFDHVAAQRDVYCLRLQGAYKDRDRRDPCLEVHKADRSTVVDWQPLVDAPEPAEVGRIHWSGQPNVTRIRPLLKLHQQPGLHIDALTARVVDNVTYHIGTERTVRPEPDEVASC